MTGAYRVPLLSLAAVIFLTLLRLLGSIVAPQAEILRIPSLEIHGKAVCYRPALGLSAPPMSVHPATVPTLSTAVPTPPATLPQPEIPVFTGADGLLVRLSYDKNCPYRPDLGALLEKKLTLDLRQEQPTVLIIHSHASECYTKEAGQDFSYTGSYRTTDTNYNMVSIGAALARLLEEAGIRVIHDGTLHDYPAYSDAYARSRKTVQTWLEEYPSIQLVLDLHRDAATNADGSQFATGVSVSGEKMAQFMLVVGTDRGANHPAWQENLSLALKLQALMERQTAGITRKSALRSSRFNQDLSTGSLIVECGSAGNTQAEVLQALPYLADAIIALVKGAN